jgi:hypothetical protein
MKISATNYLLNNGIKFLYLIFIFVMILIVATFLHNDLKSDKERVDDSKCNNGELYFNSILF